MSRVSAEVGSAANSYEILAKLAMGGMAEIFLARGASTAGVERYVVLKRILRERSRDADFIRMFLDEARLAAQLQHPNIAQVYDIGKLGESFFFTMEYVHGETVRALLSRSHALRRAIPIGSVLTVIANAAAGLHHAHDRKGMDGKPLGIVHRDVSPSNLMVSYEGTVKVVDFGVAKAATRDTETRSGTVKGKITYMSPEQCRGAEVDRRSDIFSLGIVMWEMLTTERLFRRNSDFDNMQAIVSEEVPPPSSVRPEIPAEVDTIVMTMLAKDPASRYQTADEVHEAIENAAVRSGSALSAASLGRLIRELFGQRPEPWIELQSHEAHPEAFTVTSEPIIPDQLRPSPVDELDVRLAAVPELRLSMQQTAAMPSQPVHPTVPLRVEAQQLHDNVVALPTPLPQEYPRSPTPSANYPLLSGSSPYPVVHSSASQSMSSHGSAPARRSRTMWILLPAVVLGVVLGIALAVGGDDDKPAMKAEETRTVALTQTTPAATPDAAPAPAPDAAPAPVAAPAPDAAPAPVEASPARPPPDVPPPASPKPPPPPDIATLFETGKHAEVVAQCRSSSRLAIANASTCTLAACKVKDRSRAKRWLTLIAVAKRPALIKECGGVLPAAARSKDDPCKRDHLACQH